MSTRIFILGTGAVGMLLGTKLAKNGKDVFMLQTSVDDAPFQDRDVIFESADGEIERVTLNFGSLVRQTRLEGLIVVATKSYANEIVAYKLRKLQVDSSLPIILIQNGLGNKQPFVEQGFENISRGLLYAASLQKGKHHVKFWPIADSPIGAVYGNEKWAVRFADELSTVNLSFVCSKDIQCAIWEKVAVNCVFNSICSVLDSDNGVFVRNTVANRIAVTMLEEIVTVAAEQGVDLSMGKLTQLIQDVSKNSSGQLCSTLQDLKHGRETEIRQMNLEVNRLAQEASSSLQVPTTRIMGELVTILEETQRRVEDTSNPP